MNRDEQWLLKEKYNGKKSEAFFADCQRVQSGEPLAYVIGHIPFLSVIIYLDGRPLIPRVETEFWVEKAIEEIKGSPVRNPRVLDLCAGSGCIGIAVKKAIPACIVDLAEIDTALHPTIQKNIKENDLDSATITVIGGDLVEQAVAPYDFILSNPPYIATESNRVAHSVAQFEPPLALYGGKDGLDIIYMILDKASNMLAPQGILYIEHDPEQAEVIRSYAATRTKTADTHTDQYNRARYTRFTAVQ